MIFTVAVWVINARKLPVDVPLCLQLRWGLRVLLDTEMRLTNVKKLSGTSMPMKKFVEAFPDMNTWVTKLMDTRSFRSRSNLPDMTVAQFQKTYHMSQVKPEYLTLNLCILGSFFIKANFHELCKTNLKVWLKLQKQHRKEHGIDMHPVQMQKHI